MICIQNLGIEDGIRERMKARFGSFPNLLRVCERGFVGVFMYFYVFYSLLLEKKILLGFFGFYIDIFFILQALLLEVVGVVPFCICGWISFL